ncbi:MAG TPA: hypothetical protein VII11_06220 [Bacteroidota bacterium]
MRKKVLVLSLTLIMLDMNVTVYGQDEVKISAIADKASVGTTFRDTTNQNDTSWKKYQIGAGLGDPFLFHISSRYWIKDWVYAGLTIPFAIVEAGISSVPDDPSKGLASRGELGLSLGQAAPLYLFGDGSLAGNSGFSIGLYWNGVLESSGGTVFSLKLGGRYFFVGEGHPILAIGIGHRF